MQSIILNKGNHLTLEISLDTTGVDRMAVAKAMLAAHGLRDGQVEVVFTNPSTTEVRE
jgi:hypothetical protein